MNTESENNKKQFLDLNGVEVFSKEFFKKVDELIDGRIIKSNDETIEENLVNKEGE